MLSESLDKGWKTWSTQATELQLLQADHENRKKQGPGFLNVDETSINTAWEELANDIYELATKHMEEINKMLDEFEDHQIATAVQLDAYEAERRQQEDDQVHDADEEAGKEQSGSVVHFYESREEEAESTQ
mgnify:CR=1 FL=1